ncbi:transcription termination factor 3, mitochondrial [Orussus abietinus]|uniref:transcription termination factor 3, mitochondrial n=1 Tax=Orussus abietinus TaxID=222816 RepID=UPI000625A3FA|nr:transcription termination factor 3, mitochondrial [Orussus abietinus]
MDLSRYQKVLRVAQQGWSQWSRSKEVMSRRRLGIVNYRTSVSQSIKPMNEQSKEDEMLDISLANIVKYEENNKIDMLMRKGSKAKRVKVSSTELEIAKCSHKFLPNTDPFTAKDSLTDFNEDEPEDGLLNLTDKFPHALETATEDMSYIGPYFPKSYNSAAYADRSPSIQKLVDLGVNVYKLEHFPDRIQLLLQLDIEQDMKPYIQFLHDCGVPADSLGKFITMNPMIFKQDLDDLKTRIRYLRAHGFDVPMISRIVTANPYWLLLSTTRIDRRLGYFQMEFKLSGQEVRKLTVKRPRLITYNMNHIKENTFAVREEMGFELWQTKMVLMNKPKLWTMRRTNIVDCFDYVHNVMKIPHELLAKQPDILTFRKERVIQRHKFLALLGRNQYDPSKPMYVAPKTLVIGTDLEFCQNVARESIQTYNDFLRTL